MVDDTVTGLYGAVGVAYDLLGAYASGMENKPPPPPQIPVVPLSANSLLANVVGVGYYAGNGAIMLQLGEQRPAPVQKIGDPQSEAVFEIGRFALTPRALRQLLDAAQIAAKDYESALGKPLPTMDQFNAAAAMKGLFPFPTPEDPKP